jgi:L-ascorbate metabolism protein UlaG (beta-lactamase superfamily)
MGARLREVDIGETLPGLLKQRPGEAFRLYWLGQAGFVLDYACARLIIDPYLSDSLAEKYRGTARPHTRMMAGPVLPEQCAFIDLILCTHAHTDHMDPDTLKPLITHNPSARLIAPRAVREQAALRSGIGVDQLILVDAGDSLRPIQGISITATRSAHEKLEVDGNGHHRFLGYGMDIGVARLWHSGDCIQFEGLEREARALRPDICLLPVNGRRPELSDNGVPGNFTLDEAIALSRAVGASDMIAHHYGLFDFNTEQPEAIEAAIRDEHHLQVHRAKTGVAWELIDE